MTEQTFAEELPIIVVGADGGLVSKVISSDSAGFQGFGELYFSVLAPGHFRGWKIHRKMTSALFCVSGRAEIHVVSQDGTCRTHLLRPFVERDSHALIIPPGATVGILAQGDDTVTLGNLASIRHDENELTRFERDHHECGWLD